MAMTDHDTAGGLCHQRAVRNRESAADPQVQDATLDGYFVEPIGLVEAAAFILRFEYLGTVGHPLAMYGARDQLGALAAVALFGRPTMTSTAFDVVLERGACAPWAHPHAASWFLKSRVPPGLSGSRMADCRGLL